MEVRNDGWSAVAVGLDVVVLEEHLGVASGVLAFGVAFVEDSALAAGGVAAAGAGVDGLSLGVVHQEGHEGVG